MTYAPTLYTQLTTLEQLRKEYTEGARKKLANDKNTAPATLALLTKDTDLLVSWAAAKNPSTPDAALIAYAEDNLKPPVFNYSIRVLSENKGLSQKVQSHLANHSDRRLREVFASNPYVDTKLLDSLALTPSMAQILAKNPKTSNQRLHDIYDMGVKEDAAFLRKTGLDTSNKNLVALDKKAGMSSTRSQLLYTLAMNTKLPIDLLLLLSSHWDIWIRQAIAEHSNTPENIQAILAKDKNDEVRRHVAQNKKLASSVAFYFFENRKKEQWAIHSLLYNAACPQDVLRHYAINGSREERYTVAGNRNIPDDVLADFVKRRDVYWPWLTKNSKYRRLYLK